jgi:hypothetical protein
MVLLITTLLAIALVVALAVREVVMSRRHREDYTARRIALRLTTAALIVFLLAAVLVGVQRFGLDHLGGDPVYFLAFWGCITLLTGGILCLALADFSIIHADLRREANRQWREIAELIAAHHNDREGKD